MKNKKNIFFADFGNSNAKFLLPSGKFARTDYSPSTFLTLIQSDIFADATIVYSSVNKMPLTELRKQKHIKLINAMELLKNLELIDYNGIIGIGADRLFGLTGALSQHMPPLITIDCGTAITINALDENRNVLGGTIMPGYHLQEYALQNRTKGLTEISISPPKKLLGRDTHSAMSSGIYYGIAGAVSSIVKQIRQDTFANKKINIFLTGGSSFLILPYLQQSLEIIHDELLVIKGIKHTYKLWLTEKD